MLCEWQEDIVRVDLSIVKTFFSIVITIQSHGWKANEPKTREHLYQRKSVNEIDQTIVYIL